MLPIETKWRYYLTTYESFWNQFEFFFFNSSEESVFIFSGDINIKKLHIVQPSCPYLKKYIYTLLPVNATMYTESIWFQLIITINMPIVVSTLQCMNAIQMMLTLYQTDFSISIIYHTHWSDATWKTGDIKKDHFFQFSQVIRKINPPLISFRSLICCGYLIHNLLKTIILERPEKWRFQRRSVLHLLKYYSK